MRRLPKLPAGFVNWLRVDVEPTVYAVTVLVHSEPTHAHARRMLDNVLFHGLPGNPDDVYTITSCLPVVPRFGAIAIVEVRGAPHKHGALDLVAMALHTGTVKAPADSPRASFRCAVKGLRKAKAPPITPPGGPDV